MRLRLLFIVLFVLTIACKAKDSINDDLKNTMQSYLYNEINNDSSKIKYNVQNVVFFNDKEKQRYVCEFTVNMREFTVDSKTKFDTTGMMKAYISKDLKKVTRLY